MTVNTVSEFILIPYNTLL